MTPGSQRGGYKMTSWIGFKEVVAIQKNGNPRMIVAPPSAT
jgi:hypothetical protein